MKVKMSAIIDNDMMNRMVGTRFIESACSTDTLSMYSISKCYFAGVSPYSEIVIAQSPVYGKVLFLDKELQSAESDEALYHEHLVHPILNAMCHVPMKSVLIVGGGEGATAREVLKWDSKSVARVVWIDIDKALVDLCRQHLSWADDSVYNDPRLTYISDDIRNFLQSTDMFDVVILDLPDPDVDVLLSMEKTVDGEYALYSREFFQKIKEHLLPKGAVVSHAGPISPGGPAKENRAGLEWITTVAAEVGLGSGSAYHVTIPSFQGDWGFWMSCSPSPFYAWPSSVAIMSQETQAYAFTWPSYYMSPRFGFIRQ
jgi:spermidine synthase